MLKKMSIRLRLTVMTVALLTVCCVGLTFILNISADTMATKIDATLILPAKEVGEDGRVNESPQSPAIGIISPVPSVDSQRARMDFRMDSIIYMLLVIIGGGFLTYYISGKALKPLDMLNTQVKNINVHNLSETLSVPPTKDEIAELTVTFNEMTDKLDNAFMMQARFSASAAHELRTPLAVLQTKVDVFKKREDHTNEEYDALISVIEKQTSRLRGLVGNLLDMTNMDDNGEQSSICVKDIFEEMISELDHIAKDRHVTLSLDCDNSMVTGNIDLLYRAFYNLVENGINYNVDGGKVEVVVNRLSKDQVSIQIKDTGIGIAETDKKHILEPFYRADQSRSRQMAGAGLGLTIVDSIMKKHRGTLTVTDNENGGTCFHVILNG
ncbi:sensor histidine kinase [Cohnella herbarum]|uniref:histidine kinase n=1 Tax=Cohnella herbarum TaxID=2728023 RepID=A0A7Z2VN01_9BACL|nr:HAMP domain-containing sensor histidine kinase [Cohnella herbarum]QJD86011.1 HAMP domain-containing histidine kinase [Cohnella herbarum]